MGCVHAVVFMHIKIADMASKFDAAVSKPPVSIIEVTNFLE